VHQTITTYWIVSRVVCCLVISDAPAAYTRTIRLLERTVVLNGMDSLGHLRGDQASLELTAEEKKKREIRHTKLFCSVHEPQHCRKTIAGMKHVSARGRLRSQYSCFILPKPSHSYRFHHRRFTQIGKLGMENLRIDMCVCR
jgi:hypothetical protein